MQEAMEEGWLERDGVRLHWREWPAAAEPREPSLFCLHGLSSNSMYWGRLAARFPHRRVVALDQRSHGLSDRPPEGYTNADLSGDAAFAIRELGLDRPLVLGHSWGASVALGVAALPDTPAGGLVHLDGPLRAFSNLMSWEQASVVMQPPLKRYFELDEAFDEQRAYLEGGWGDDLRQFVESGLMRDGDAYRLPLTAEVRLQILRELFYTDFDELWRRVDGLPVVVAIAERAPEPIASWKRSNADEVARLASHAEIEWFDSAHDIPLHLPDQVAATVERLAAQVEDSSRTIL
jgi:pimeloyl-ACP methyl ester carboxylesterase